MKSIKFLPGQVHTGKLIAKTVEHRAVGTGKTVTSFKLLIGNKIKDAEGKYVPKMKKDAAGNDVECVAFIKFETWSDATRAKIEQAINTKGVMTVVEFDCEDNNYEGKDGKTVYSVRNTVKFIKNYVFESSEWHLLDNPVAEEGEAEEMPF